MSVLVKTLLLALLLQPVVGDEPIRAKAAEKEGTGVEIFQYLLDHYDGDGDKALSLDEVFKSALITPAVTTDHADKVTTPAVLINAFRDADVNGDGNISGPEMQRMLAEVKWYHHKHQEVAEARKRDKHEEFDPEHKEQQRDQSPEESQTYQAAEAARATGMVRGRWLDIARSSGKPGGGATGAMEKYDLDKDKRLSNEEVFGDIAATTYAEHKQDPNEDYQVSAVVMHQAFKVADKDNNLHLTDGELVDFLRQVIWFDHAYQKHGHVGNGWISRGSIWFDQVVPDKMARGKWLDIANSLGQPGGGATAALDQFDADNDKTLTEKEILRGPIKSTDAAQVGQVQEVVVREAFKAATPTGVISIRDHAKNGLERPEIVTFLKNIIWLSHVHDHHGSIAEGDAMPHKLTVHIRHKWMTLAGGLGKPGGGAGAVMEQVDHNNDGQLDWKEVIGEPNKKKDWADEEQVSVQVLSRAFEVADENEDHFIAGAEVYSFLSHIISYNNFAAYNEQKASSKSGILSKDEYNKQKAKEEL